MPYAGIMRACLSRDFHWYATMRSPSVSATHLHRAVDLVDDAVNKVQAERLHEQEFSAVHIQLRPVRNGLQRDGALLRRQPEKIIGSIKVCPGCKHQIIRISWTCRFGVHGPTLGPLSTAAFIKARPMALRAWHMCDSTRAIADPQRRGQDLRSPIESCRGNDQCWGMSPART